MNNTNPLYFLEESIKKRLMRKAINSALPETLKSQGKKTAAQAAKMSERFFSKGLSDNGVVKGKVGDLYNRAIATKKGQELAHKIATR